MGLLSKNINLAAIAAALLAASIFPVQAETAQGDGFPTKAPQVLLIDDGSDTVLLSKNPDKKVPPASLAKLMTAEIVFDALKGGQITLETAYPVSEYAWRTGGAPSRTSTMFARIKSTPTVADLLQGMIVQAANDGAIVLAEGLAGSEQAFAGKMNDRAAELGLRDSRFVNATGLPAQGQAVTLSDLTKLARHIHSSYPEYYPYYAQPAFTWNNIFQRNRNPLLRLEVGADGMGTGFAEESGYALVASAQQHGRRLFLAMSGLASAREREEEARKLIEWGMNAFDKVHIYAANERVGEAQVFGGALNHVALKVDADVELLLPKEGRNRLKARILYDGPLHAPLEADKQIGSMQFELDGNIVRQIPLFTAQPVVMGSLSQRAMGAAFELATGWLRKYF
ncbi:D-alanyl-D-alanine carboxypeptidase [Falsochrobactrum shanghaiense]|uniref:serine-type D-Ala-D-Ala carboxypeptidase n=1 Tax=Falsochrobactrum shanghaiense TaxID=2201899 RepID=A0A316J7N7_9HYPH|nr:D-alanyl-D-alanine carboxypeptidase family protein [Falsochrobactrum shanghaiense]PWL17942.1 D-alanyl-D-alanine carboxypeptidase [Falsochrobactrum shanghaiense]